MSFDLFDKQAFLNAVTPAEKPVAFLVGSPLSWDNSGGVAGVDDMCKFIREMVQSRKARALASFDAAIKDKNGANLYQTALRWLQGNVSQFAVNEVIRQAVLGARRLGTHKEFADDGAPEDWHLPAGTMQLAELVCRYPDEFPGPLLTTNFDPLLSLAIRAMGGKPHRRIADSDGNIGREAENEAGVRMVAHLHGYWRASDTLHTSVQLTANRPKLRAALQATLRSRTLVVVAYSGWDDVFTTALADLLHDEEAQLDVLWCFREAEQAVVAARYARLIEKMQPAIARGVFRAYGGVDCHSIFGEVVAEMAASTKSESSLLASASLSSPLPGWECLDATTLDAMEPLRESEARRYYDGAVPGWRHAMSEFVPRREAVSTIADRRSRLDEDRASMQLIRAAGGEGKTTLLLQAAVDAAKNEGVRILWRPSPKFSFSPEQLTNLSPEFQWLIVADDAENLVTSIIEAARKLSHAKHANVDFLLAARDSDWRAKGGDRLGWAQWIQYQQDVILRGLSESDADAVVAAWSKAGGLRELEKEAAFTRSALLLKAVKDQSGSNIQRREDGSFFGGLLKVRFSEAGLRAHVREFLTQLRATPIYKSERTLADALQYVAACHGAGISGLDENVLADLLDVPRDWLGSRVTRPLGEEAVAVSGGGRVFTRHTQVAAAVLLEVEAALEVDLAEVWAQVVKQTVRTSSQIPVHYETHSKVIHAGPRLEAALPQQMSKDRRKAIAISAAMAAIAANVERLDVVTDLGKTYRMAGGDWIGNAICLFRGKLAEAISKVDYKESIRGYWYEWGVCEGHSGREDGQHANAWLAGIALSDHLNPAKITEADVKINCGGLGVAFGNLATTSANCPFSRARRAVIDIGRRVPLDQRGVELFDRHESESNELGTECPKDLGEAIDWLVEGIAAAGALVAEKELTHLIQFAQPSFRALQAKLRQ